MTLIRRVLFASILAMSPAIGFAGIGVVPGVGLVGHWGADESGGSLAADSSGNGNNATLMNNPGRVAGVAGNGMQFTPTNGSANVRNYLKFPANLQAASFPRTGSLSFWLKGDFSTQNNRNVLDAYGGSRNHFFVRTRSGGTLQVALQDAAGNYVNGAYLMPVDSNAWNHVTLVWDSVNKMAFFYKNGTLVGSNFWGAANPAWVPDGELMQFNSPFDFDSSNITLDDVALYNRVLAPAEVRAIFAGTPGPVVDTAAPAAPANLVTSGMSASAVVLGWDAATDDSAIAGYVLYRNGVPIAKLAGNVRSYLDSGLTANTRYSYSVYAFDEFGNTSVVSNVASGTTLDAAMLFQADQESNTVGASTLIPGWSVQGPTNSVSISTEFARAGSKALKFDFNRSDWSTSNTFLLRSEVVPNAPAIEYALGQTYWTGFSEFLPTTWENDYVGNEELIWQYHGGPDGAGSHSPPLSFVLSGDTAQVRLLAGTGVYATNPATTVLLSMPVSELKGHWTDWVIQTKFDYNNGIVNIWRNGVRMVTYSGPTTYRTTQQLNESGAYLKLGVYKWWWGTSTTRISNRTMFVDEVRVGSDAATCQRVAPGGACN